MTETTIAPEITSAAGGSKPIASYGLLSDCNSAALVGTDGSIDRSGTRTGPRRRKPARYCSVGWPYGSRHSA